MPVLRDAGPAFFAFLQQNCRVLFIKFVNLKIFYELCSLNNNYGDNVR